MERDEYRYTQFEAPGPVMGGMRWGDGRPRLEDFCRRTGVVYRKYPREETMPAPLAHVGPSIVTVAPEVARAGAEYVYQASARDADTNGFTWSFVKPPPPGMEIDRYGGKITWTPAASCRVEIEIRAYTHHGRQARQAWTINVGKAAVVRAAVAHPRFLEALRRKRLRRDGRPRPAVFTGPRRRMRPWQSCSPKRIAPSGPECPGPAGTGTETPRRRRAATGPPFRCPWSIDIVRGRTAGRACPATAPPGRRQGAPLLPLRL